VSFIKEARKLGNFPEQYAHQNYGVHETNRHFSQQLKCFEDILVENNVYTFSDMLYLPLKLMREQPTLVEKKYKYILIDEWQDVSTIQMMLIGEYFQGGGEGGGGGGGSTSKPSFGITVAGDDDQSIFSFNGVVPACFHVFKQIFEGRGCTVKETKLELNYRSNNSILRAAKSVLVHHALRKDKELRALDPTIHKEAVTVAQCGTPEDEAAVIA
jgi:DNA helicase-2/ATP-dependent DNA helicase PcrA